MSFAFWDHARGCMGPRFRGGDKDWWLRALLLIACAALASLAAHGPASAHAVLLGSEPPHRAVLEQPPHHLVLRFNEPVTPLFVRLVDASGRERALPQPARAVDREVHAPLPSDLGAGTYLASFRVVSADGHPVAGAILFAIGGAPGEAPVAPANAETGWRLSAIAVRALQLVCLFLAAGGLLFATFVSGEKGRWLGTLAAAAALAGLAGIVLHGAALSGALDATSAAFWRTALATPQAASALASIGGLAVAFAAAPRLGRSIGSRVGVLGAVFALSAAGVTGHSAAAGALWWIVAAAHFVAAGFWFGSLPPLWRLLRAENPRNIGALLRFSRIAVPGVAALITAGVALAWQRMDGLGDLVATDYGRLVIAKLAAAALLVAIAARNKFALTPALARADDRAGRRLRGAIAFELALMTGVIAVAAVLAHTDPHAGHGHGHRGDVPTPRGVSLHLVSGERAAAVMLTPARPGKNALRVAFATRDGRAIRPLEATLVLSLRARGIEGLSVQLVPSGAGAFAAEIAEIAVPGRWELRIDALITDFEKAIFRGEIDIR